MTPAKRHPATPASQGPTRTAPDVPVAADPPAVPAVPPDASVPDELGTATVPPAATEDGTQLLGPDGEPVAEDRSTKQSPRRSRSLYPLPVWPD